MITKLPLLETYSEMLNKLHDCFAKAITFSLDLGKSEFNCRFRNLQTKIVLTVLDKETYLIYDLLKLTVSIKV